jgi:hypothetical protein
VILIRLVTLMCDSDQVVGYNVILIRYLSMLKTLSKSYIDAKNLI